VAGARFFAHGRVNLIGEHTDYGDGLVLPAAIELGVTAVAGAVCAAADLRPPPFELAPIARRAEERATGVP
jgi:galactokinase